MKAPDKIYVPTRFQLADCLRVRESDTDVCYIRKDALLEWAKECFRLQDSGSWYSKGAADAFSKLIDKLNSM